MTQVNGKRPPGRPKKDSPSSTGEIKYGKGFTTISDQIDEKGVEEFNPNVADRQITLLMRKVLEKGLMSKDILLEKKVDWSLRGIALFEGTKSTIWNKDERRDPKTAMQIEKDKARITERIIAKQRELVKIEKPSEIDVLLNSVEDVSSDEVN